MTRAKPPRRKTNTQRGLGWRHRQAADALRRALRDGTPCEVCGEPMYRDRTRNWDYDPEGGAASGTLHADHSKLSRYECLTRGIPIPLADRLVHSSCNTRLGAILGNSIAAGLSFDEVRGEVRGQARSDGLEPRAMDWPI